MCKDCKYWGRYRDKVCDAIELGSEGDKGVFINVRVSDDSGLDAWLVTPPNFHCNKYEAQP